MRLWSLHPNLLDSKGLVACWREGLGAQKVLIAHSLGYKIGYSKHPQLDRFYRHPEPLEALGVYLQAVFIEAGRRGYSFDATKLNTRYLTKLKPRYVVSWSQIAYEWEFLLSKLQKRAPNSLQFSILANSNALDLTDLLNPAFKASAQLKVSKPASWEKVSNQTILESSIQRLKSWLSEGK